MILRVRSSRLAVLTFEDTLSTIRDTHSTTVMNKRRFIYEVVLGPDQQDDSLSPLSVLDELALSSGLKAKLAASMTSLDLTYTMITREVSLTKPQIRGNGM